MTSKRYCQSTDRRQHPPAELAFFWNESRRGTAPTLRPSRAGNSKMMRRGKKTSNPVCSKAPALRQKAVLIKKPEAPVDCSSLGSPASNGNSQGDSLQPPESQLPPCRAEEPPLPLFLSEIVDGCRDLDAAAPLGTMLNFFRSIPTQMVRRGRPGTCLRRALSLLPSPG